MENNDEATPPAEKRNNSGKNLSFPVDKNSYLDSESDLNTDHLIGNVQRVAIVPPSHEGKPKKGHLIFDAAYECGMLNRNFSHEDFIVLINRQFGSS